MGNFSGLVTQKIILFVLLTSLIITSGCAWDDDQVTILNLTTTTTTTLESAVGELTPIIIIGAGEGGTVAVYKCSSGTDCNRCQDGDVYGQACIDNTCQGSLDLIEDCEDGCSAGECIEKEPTDETQCSPGIEKCPGYERGIGTVYLTKFPECECKYIYIPEGCNPLEPPCPDYSPRTEYPECACE